MTLDSLFKDQIDHKQFLNEYNGLLKVVDIVAATIKHMTAQYSIEVWETTTAIPILTETYNQLISLKRKIGAAFLSAETTELLSLTSKEKVVVREHIAIIESNRKILRTLFGICIDPNVLS